MTDFSTYKFRCSGLRHLMVNPKKKTELLSESTKTYLKDIYIKEVYGRDRGYQTISKFTQKGTMVESDSLDLVEKVTGKRYFKNLKEFSNDWIKGTPDVIPEEKVIDIKSNWDLWTFGNISEDKARTDYYYQVLGYMWLTGKKIGDLNFCLVNTPDMLIEDEIYRLKFKIGDDEADKYRINYKFDDIPDAEKFKEYSFDFDALAIEELKMRIVASRSFLQEMKL